MPKNQPKNDQKKIDIQSKNEEKIIIRPLTEKQAQKEKEKEEKIKMKANKKIRKQRKLERQKEKIEKNLKEDVNFYDKLQYERQLKAREMYWW